MKVGPESAQSGSTISEYSVLVTVIQWGLLLGRAAELRAADAKGLVLSISGFRFWAMSLCA